MKSLIDPCFSLEIDRWGAGGEEEIGSPNQKKFFGVGRIGKSGWVGGGGKGTGLEKSLKIWNLKRMASLNMGIINWTDNVN